MPQSSSATRTPYMEMENDYTGQRHRMVEEQLVPRGISGQRLLEAFLTVERHRFMPPEDRGNAYCDGAFPLPNGQTISQPYIVALMTQMLDVRTGHRVLEIGTGSGYQTAILDFLGAEVYTVEQDALLAAESAALLAELGARNVHCRHGNGWEGWPEAAPFERIIVTCAAPRVPEALADQLGPGGRMVLPVGDPGNVQYLYIVRKDPKGRISREKGLAVRFVPMIE